MRKLLIGLFLITLTLFNNFTYAADEYPRHDVYGEPVIFGVTNDSNTYIKQIRVDSVTGGILFTPNGTFGAAAPTTGFAIGGVYNTSFPTYTDGQLGQIQIDSSGRLIIASPAVVGSTADNAANPTNKIPVLPCVANASSPSWTEGHVVPCSEDLSGNLRVNVGSITASQQIQVTNSAGSSTNVGFASANIPMPVTLSGANGPATYSLNVAGINSINGDQVVLPGNATNTAYVTHVDGFVSFKANAVTICYLGVRSSADTSGTSMDISRVPHNSSSSASVSIPLNYTVAPTPGSLVGQIRSVSASTATGVNPQVPFSWDFGGNGQEITLKGAAQQLVFNCNGTGSVYDISITWKEYTGGP